MTQPMQEPAFYIIEMELEALRRDGRRAVVLYTRPITNGIEVPVYTTPPQRTWVGLTGEDTQAAWDAMKDYDDFDTYAKVIEAKLKEKNA